MAMLSHAATFRSSRGHYTGFFGGSTIPEFNLDHVGAVLWCGRTEIGKIVVSTLKEALRSIPKSEVPTCIAPPVDQPSDDAFAGEGFRLHGRTRLDKIRLPVLSMQII